MWVRGGAAHPKCALKGCDMPAARNGQRTHGLLEASGRAASELEAIRGGQRVQKTPVATSRIPK